MSDRNVEQVKELYARFGRGDIEAVLRAMADDIEWCEAEGMPYGDPPFHGPQEVVEKVLGPITTDVVGSTAAPERYLASGEVVIALGRYLGTGKETGKPLDLPFAHVWELSHGKLERFVQFTDTAKFLEVVPAAVATAA